MHVLLMLRSFDRIIKLSYGDKDRDGCHHYKWLTKEKKYNVRFVGGKDKII